MKKGFTLIELLIVIGILAVLAGIIVVALNPAELLRQARDSKRMADVSGIVGGINLYLADVASTTFTSCATGGYATASSTGGTPFNTAVVASTGTSVGVSGDGWLPVFFSWVSGGSPIAALPLDPTNSVVYNYNFACTTTGNVVFEVDARLESTKYRGSMTTDGGDNNTCTTYLESDCWYESGSSLTM